MVVDKNWPHKIGLKCVYLIRRIIIKICARVNAILETFTFRVAVDTNKCLEEINIAYYQCAILNEKPSDKRNMVKWRLKLVSLSGETISYFDRIARDFCKQPKTVYLFNMNMNNLQSVNQYRGNDTKIYTIERSNIYRLYIIIV